MADIFLIDLKYTHSAVNGDLETVDGLENYKQALIHRWITTPGDYAARPGYGAGLRLFQNMAMTVGNQVALAKAIEEQTLLDPRTEKVLGVQIALSDTDPSKFRIRVRVKPLGYEEYGINYSPFDQEA